jgi:hypothetical protein
MTAGLPGTGIGGIFYFLLAICMPIFEAFRTIQRRTSLARWGFIALQLSFVFGILAMMWGEVWLLNYALIWLKETLHINWFSVNWQFSFGRTRTIAAASALASFISLMLVMSAVHIARFFVNRPSRSDADRIPLGKAAAQAQYRAA